MNISIFGHRITTSTHVCVVNEETITIGGVEIKVKDASRIKVDVQGDVQGSVGTMSGDVSVSGNSHSISTMSGDVRVGKQTSGSISTMSGDVTVG